MNAKEMVAKVKTLPPVPNAALRLIRLLDMPDAENDDVVQSIRFDNVLTAKLLRACNSPYFGFAEPVASVDQAVLVLGHQQILHIVLTLAFGASMAVPLPGYASESSQLWQHSLTAAMAAEVAAESTYEVNVESSVAFTAGLLHDIGKIVVGQVIDPLMQASIRERIALEGLDRAAAERAILGTDHAEVGAYLLRSWNLPELLTEAVANHHAPSVDTPGRLSAVTHVANWAAHQSTATPTEKLLTTELNPAVVAGLGIPTDRLEQMVVAVRDCSESVGQFMALA